MKVIVVGRHKPADMGVEVVGQQDITFPSTSAGCQYILHNLVALVREKDADGLVFQGLPGQIAVAVAKYIELAWVKPQIGVIVSVPGERPSAITQIFYFDNSTALKEAWGIANLLNPNAKILTDYQEMWLEITVDPPMKFEFSHIEWF